MQQDQRCQFSSWFSASPVLTLPRLAGSPREPVEQQYVAVDAAGPLQENEGIRSERESWRCRERDLQAEAEAAFRAGAPAFGSRIVALTWDCGEQILADSPVSRP